MLCLYSIEKLINYKKSYIANYYSLSFLKKSLQYTLLLLLKLKENDVKATFRKSFCRPFLQTKMSERNCYFVKMRKVSYSKFLKQTFNFFLFHARYIEKIFFQCLRLNLKENWKNTALLCFIFKWTLLLLRIKLHISFSFFFLLLFYKNLTFCLQYVCINCNLAIV